MPEEKKRLTPPLFYMPPQANIPKQWVLADNAGHMDIVVPSWSFYRAMQKYRDMCATADAKGEALPPKPLGLRETYTIRMIMETRQLFCDCEGFRFTRECHHIKGLIWFTTMPRTRRGIKEHGVSETSLLSYYSFDEIDLGARQDVVAKALKQHGPMSNKQISVTLNWPINCITPRVKELREMGMVAETGYHYDENTLRWEKVWANVSGVA